MPVRLRCPECSKVLNIPDAARGKNVKCPQCEARIKVPAGKQGGGSKQRPARKKPARSRPEFEDDDDDSNIFDNFDERMAEDRHVKLCPKCAVEVDEEDIECPACGVNIETGQLSARQKKMRERVGPDPAEYYTVIWSDSFEYMLHHWKLCLKSGFILTFCAVMMIVSAHTRLWVIDREFEARKEAETENAKNLQEGQKPKTEYQLQVEAVNSPPAFFWNGVGTVFMLCSTGWSWLCWLTIIKDTMDKEKPIETVKFDFFSMVALGVKATVWPLVLILPFFWFPPIWLLPLVALPIAMVHFTQRHSYKAYLPVDMVMAFARSAGPCLYWLLVALGVGLVHVAGVVVVLVVMQKKTLEMFGKWAGKFENWLGGDLMGMDEGTFFRYLLAEMPAVTMLALAFALPFYLTAGFPQIMVMRAGGIFGKYFRPELGIEGRKGANVPAGFWARWLAHLIDVVVINVLFVLFWVLVFMLMSLAARLGINNDDAMKILMQDFGDGLTYGGTIVLILVWVGGGIGFPIAYYVISESGLGKATLGKRAIGLIVTDEKGNQLTRSAALGRTFGKIVSAIPLLAGYFMAAFDPKKQALHDKMAKAMVVWRGDDETTESS